MTRRSGISPRALQSRTGISDLSQRKRARSARVFYTAVVVDFFANPVEDLERIPVGEESLTLKESLLKGVNLVENTKIVSNYQIPRNSIIGWRVDDRAAYSNEYEIFLPFFSPHLCLPLKPGEQVWVIYENSGEAGLVGYWISRKIAPENVDDLNYTHHDRSTLDIQSQSRENSAKGTMSGAPEDSFDPLAFPEGGSRTQEKNTMPQIDGQSAYEVIVSSANGYLNQFTAEPVPRFSKRCADLTIQGSNNTLISMGEDRGGGGSLGTSVDTSILGKGTIDMVAGRSALLNDGTFIYTPVETMTEESPTTKISSAENPTAPAAVALNTRQVGEIDKTPIVTESNMDGPNINEGDPDFTNDLSRVYVSMKTNGDRNLGLDFPDLKGASVSQVDEDAYVVIKSNELRLVARHSSEKGINGSIKIVKEGVIDGSDHPSRDGDGRAIIVMQPDGTIIIDGPKIIIGGHHLEANGSGKTILLGSEATEPIVMGNQLVSVLSAIIDALDNHIHTSPAGPTGTRDIPTPGASKTLPNTWVGTSAVGADLNKILSKIGKTK